MKAQHLRIGNSIKDRGGKTLVVDRICGNKIECDVRGLPTEDNGIPIHYHPYTEEIEYLQPIPLTEEWLLKFGFDKRLHGWWSEMLFLRFNEMNQNILWFDWNGTTQTEGVKISYVHELQNLYYALTKKELTS